VDAAPTARPDRRRLTPVPVFAVAQGEGFVAADDAVRVPIAAGTAAVWSPVSSTPPGPPWRWLWWSRRAASSRRSG